MVGVGLEHAGVGVTGSAVRRIDHEGLLGPVWREPLVAEAGGVKARGDLHGLGRRCCSRAICRLGCGTGGLTAATAAAIARGGATGAVAALLFAGGEGEDCGECEQPRERGAHGSPVQRARDWEHRVAPDESLVSGVGSCNFARRGMPPVAQGAQTMAPDSSMKQPPRSVSCTRWLIRAQRLPP